MTDSSGTVIYNCTFNPFGEQFGCSPDNPSNHYRFTGKERDSEDNLDDFGARYFSSSMGRWMTPDWSARPTTAPYAEFGDPQSLNLYLYVRNDPVSVADADGHVGWDGGVDSDFNFAMKIIHDKDFWDRVRQDSHMPKWEGGQGQSKCGFWCRLGQRMKNGLTGHGFKTNEQLLPKGTVTTSQEFWLKPNFYSGSVAVGPTSQSVAYVPSWDTLYYSPGAATGAGIALTAGKASDPDGFASGTSGSVCFFSGVGGCAGASTSGDTAVQVGVGVGGWGASAGYGLTPDEILKGMVNSIPNDPTIPKGVAVMGVRPEDIF